MVVVITSSRSVLGCDPGAKGAICILHKTTNGTGIKFVDHNNSAEFIDAWLSTMHNELDVKAAMLEDVHSLYGMSAKSNFSFGKNLGIAETLLKIQPFPLSIVQPKIWQKAVGVDIPKDIKGPARSKAIKARVGELCEELYPGCKIWGPRGGLMDGRSDALMIAHYCLHN